MVPLRPALALALAPLVLATSCSGFSLIPEPDFTPQLVVSDDAYLWQGLTHDWLYNHRWGRLGSGFVHTDPALDPAAYPLHGEVWEPQIPTGSAWTYMGSAGAGTGKDIGTHIGRGVHISSPDLQFASLTAHQRIRGAEGTPNELDDWVVSAELPEGWADAEDLTVVLNGFWLQAVNEEAKQPQRFALQVGEATLSGGSVEVPVSVEFTADCDTPECTGCFTDSTSPVSDDLQVDLFVGLLFIAGADAAFDAERFDGPRTAAHWEGPLERGGEEACLGEGDRGDCMTYWVDCGDPVLADYEELPDDAGRDAVAHTMTAARPTGTVGITGLEFTLDAAHHMVAFDASATDVAWDDATGHLDLQQNLRFQNWRHDMNILGQDADVLSLTSYGVEGSFEGSMQWAALGFADATLADATQEATIITEVTQLVILDLDTAR